MEHGTYILFLIGEWNLNQIVAKDVVRDIEMSDGEFPDGFSDEDTDTPDDTPDGEGEVFSRAQGRVNNSGCGLFKCALL